MIEAGPNRVSYMVRQAEEEQVQLRRRHAVWLLEGQSDGNHDTDGLGHGVKPSLKSKEEGKIINDLTTSAHPERQGKRAVTT